MLVWEDGEWGEKGQFGGPGELREHWGLGEAYKQVILEASPRSSGPQAGPVSLFGFCSCCLSPETCDSLPPG